MITEMQIRTTENTTPHSLVWLLYKVKIQHMLARELARENSCPLLVGRWKEVSQEIKNQNIKGYNFSSNRYIPIWAKQIKVTVERYSYVPDDGTDLSAHQLKTGWRKCGPCAQGNAGQPLRQNRWARRDIFVEWTKAAQKDRDHWSPCAWRIQKHWIHRNSECNYGTLILGFSCWWEAG